MVIFEVTNNPAFNYFFSIPIWFFIMLIPILLAFSVFRHLK